MAFRAQGSFPPGTPVTWSGKGEETFVVRLIVIKKTWCVQLEGGGGRALPGPPQA